MLRYSFWQFELMHIIYRQYLHLNLVLHFVMYCLQCISISRPNFRAAHQFRRHLASIALHHEVNHGRMINLLNLYIDNWPKSPLLLPMKPMIRTNSNDCKSVQLFNKTHSIYCSDWQRISIYIEYVLKRRLITLLSDRFDGII